MDQKEQGEYCNIALSAALDGGATALQYYRRDFKTAIKVDHSPVTDADLQVERVIIKALSASGYNIPIISEESYNESIKIQTEQLFVLVDPIDGTKEFISGDPNFTVNIGLIYNSMPVVGVVYAPAHKRIWWGVVGSGAWTAALLTLKQLGPIRPFRVGALGTSLRSISSKSHSDKRTEAWLTNAGIAKRAAIGSSLKFIMVASGQADVYPRLGPTKEWDTAAGDAILRAAGGLTVDAEGMALLYGKQKLTNSCFLALASPDLRPLTEHL